MKGRRIMYLIIGNDHVINGEEVISILDYQLLKTSSKFNNLMEMKIGKNKVLGDEADAKSVILTDDYLYYSPFSTLTLKKRESFLSAVDQLENY